MKKPTVILSSSTDDLGGLLSAAWPKKSSVIAMSPQNYVDGVTIQRGDGAYDIFPDLPVVPCVFGSVEHQYDCDTQYFLEGERMSFLLSVLALTHSLVVNRPTRYSSVGNLSEVPFITFSRSKMKGLLKWPKEVFTGGTFDAFKIFDKCWVLNVASGDTNPANTGAQADGVFRCVEGCADPSYEIVFIAGNSVWRKSKANYSDAFLLNLSQDIGAKLGLQLCALTWRFERSRYDHPSLIAVDPWPSAKILAHDIERIASCLERFIT